MGPLQPDRDRPSQCAEKDQARGMFKRFYGEEWTEEYIHGFLFDLERKLPQAATIGK